MNEYQGGNRQNSPDINPHVNGYTDNLSAERSKYAYQNQQYYANQANNQPQGPPYYQPCYQTQGQPYNQYAYSGQNNAPGQAYSQPGFNGQRQDNLYGYNHQPYAQQYQNTSQGYYQAGYNTMYPMNNPVNQPYYGGYAPVTQSGNGLGIAGLVLGIIALTLQLPCSVIGLILSIAGLSQAKRANMKNSVATVGLILNIIAFVIHLLLFIAIIIASFSAETGEFPFYEYAAIIYK